MKKFTMWLIKTKDYKILIMGIALLVIGFSIKLSSLFMIFNEYKEYIQLSVYYKALYNIQQVIKLTIKVASMIFGGFLIGEYFGRKVINLKF